MQRKQELQRHPRLCREKQCWELSQRDWSLLVSSLAERMLGRGCRQGGGMCVGMLLQLVASMKAKRLARAKAMECQRSPSRRTMGVGGGLSCGNRCSNVGQPVAHVLCGCDEPLPDCVNGKMGRDLRD